MGLEFTSQETSGQPCVSSPTGHAVSVDSISVADTKAICSHYHRVLLAVVGAGQNKHRRVSGVLEEKMLGKIE